MTKYVLNSGGIKNQPELKKKFHRELISDRGDTPEFLLVNFAQGREYWESKFPAYSNAIAVDLPESVTPSFSLAMPAEFVAQCEQADVIYFHGGDQHMLLYWMQQYDMKKLFKNKVVATNSASSDMLAQSFWTCDWRACMDGFGILPIKFIPHFKSNFGSDDPRGPVDWDKAYQELSVYGDTSLPVYALQEGEFKVFEVEEEA
jgi:hypothetical protein